MAPYKSLVYTQFRWCVHWVNTISVICKKENINNNNSFLYVKFFTEKDTGVFGALYDILYGAFCVVKSFMLDVWQYSKYTSEGNETHLYFRFTQ